MAQAMGVRARTTNSTITRKYLRPRVSEIRVRSLHRGLARGRPVPLVIVSESGDSPDGRGKPNRTLEVATSGLASISRLPFGVNCGVFRDPGTQVLRKKGTKTLTIKLYEFEACPFCRRVREAITDLDLNVEIYPCPRGSERHRQVVRELGGKEVFPFLIDESTGTQMYESADIVTYLYEQYGGGAKASPYLLPSTLLTGWMPLLFRPTRGALRDTAAVSGKPEKLLKLYNYDGNQFARLVREVLCELEVPYLLVSCGKGSLQREDLKDVSGKTTVPYIIDPNTGKQLGDSEQIIDYLYATYSTDTRVSS